MNIAFDATAILGPMSKNRGIGNYALSQFTTMIDNDEHNKYFFFNTMEEFDLKDIIVNKERLQESFYFCGKDRFLLSNPEYKNIYGELVKSFIKDNDIDVFYITSPFESQVQCYEREWFNGVFVIATVYDVIPYVMKEHYLKDRTALNWYMKYIDMLRWVDRCLVISQSVKDDMITHLNFEGDKIDVIYGAVDSRFHKIKIEDDMKNSLLKKFGINNQFVMCTGGDDERKNIEGLINAYSQLEESLIEEFQLVIVCKLSQNSIERYSKFAEEKQIRNRVVFTNFVTDDELLQLYNLAYALAFPSKYEGFGLPVVEAFACQIPVVTSCNSSLGEIAGDAAILVNPFDLNDVSRGLKEILTIETSELVARGLKRLDIFNWDNVAQLAINSINNNYKKMEVSEKMEERKKIAFFSPLPPIQSGISDYSLDIINELVKYFDIDVFIDKGYTVEGELDKNIQVYSYEKYAKRRKIYYETIYQVGNSQYHEYMFELIKKYNGIVVLHDYNLHGIVQYLNVWSEYNLKKYQQIMSEDYSEEETKLFIDNVKENSTVSESSIYEYELNGFITNYAKKIIVHSNDAKKKLLEKDISRNVQVIRSYAKIEPRINKVETKEKLNLSKDNTIMASFGHIHNTKRVMPILEAFNRLRKEFGHIQYIFVGKLDDAIRKRFEEYIKANELEGLVQVTGYTTLEEFNDYIDATDICLNLRYPYNGETSGSLMRILAKGKCVMVNDIGSFGEVPENACIKLPNVEEITEKEEIQNIYDAVRGLLTSEEKIQQYESGAHQYAEESLDISIIGRKYKNFLNSSSKNMITEKILQQIAHNHILEKGYSDNEIKELANILAFICHR